MPKIKYYLVQLLEPAQLINELFESPKPTFSDCGAKAPIMYGGIISSGRHFVAVYCQTCFEAKVQEFKRNDPH